MLVYPEQSMWWNYRKPKPLKKGAYTFAAKNHVPVLPCFITMEDSDILGDDGFYVQRIHDTHCRADLSGPTENTGRKCGCDAPKKCCCVETDL